MNREEAFDKILKYLYQNKGKKINLIGHKTILGIKDNSLIRSICDEMIKRKWVKYDKNELEVYLTYEGKQIVENYDSYSSFLRELKKSESKEQAQKTKDRKLNNASKISAMVFALLAFILTITKLIIDNNKIKSQKTEIEFLKKTIDSLKNK